MSLVEKDSRPLPRSAVNPITILLSFERYLELHGAQGNSHLLLIEPLVTPRLYPAFYRKIKIETRRQAVVLGHTLLLRPERAQYVKSLWFILDTLPPFFPYTMTAKYWSDFRPSSHCKRAIRGCNIQAVCTILRACAGTVKQLTVITASSFKVLLRLLGHLSLPKLKELDVPEKLFMVMLPARIPSLEKLRLSVNVEDEDTQDLFTPFHDFTAFKSLKWLHIGYGNVDEHGDLLYRMITEIKTNATVDAVVLESERGLHLPMTPDEMRRFCMHPKVVFLLQDDWRMTEHYIEWVASADRELLYERALELPSEDIAQDMVQDMIPAKVVERWKNFESDLDIIEEDRADVLDGPEVFVLKGGHYNYVA
ncbi:hypothetical protein VNI00_018158 [Paramarasmius palmivorus]|uniref:Uncharacterized protein n=1 Tax=Paramarasmius palmivorus TaxID=297713 RepID=A0AAW0B098_9AGAR